MRVLIVSSGNNATSTANPAAPACVGRIADFLWSVLDRLVQKKLQRKPRGFTARASDGIRTA